MPDINREPEDTDPTRLTTAAIQREILILERELAAVIVNAKEVTASQMALLEARIDAVKELTNTKLDALTILLNERFSTSVKALDAAFSAAALAVGTAQLAADKAVDRERESNLKRFDQLDERVGKLSSAVDKTAGGDAGLATSQLSTRFNIVLAVSIVSILIAVVSIFVR